MAAAPSAARVYGLVVRVAGAALLACFGLALVLPDALADELFGDVRTVRLGLVTFPAVVGTTIVFGLCVYAAAALISTPDETSPHWLPKPAAAKIIADLPVAHANQAWIRAAAAR